jgi:predicted amidohydrolase
MPAQEQPLKQYLKIGIAQMHPQLGDVSANIEKLAEFVEQAAAQEVDLLVTPELALTGYPVGAWFSSASLTAASPEFGRLKELSRQVPMIVGLIEETEDVEFFNSAVYLHDGQVGHLHRKIYLPTYREFDERRYFMAGWSVAAFETPWCRMGMLICGDCWHLGLPYLLAHDGADVIIALAASAVTGLTEAISSRESWERMNRSYALTLSNFVVFSNLVGEINGTAFWGGSHVVLPDGSLLGQANFEEEELLVLTLDLNRLREQRLILPFRRDDSLSLTTRLGNDILERKGARIRGLWGPAEGHPPSSASIPSVEPRFPPVGVSDVACDQSPHQDGPPAYADEEPLAE